MIEDNYNILNLLNENKGAVNLDKLMDIISSGLQKDILNDTDKELLNLVFNDNPEQYNLDRCLANYDIEKVGGHKALMLAYFMKMHPSLKYSDYVAPRLKGLLQYYRFQNLKLISHFSKIGKELHKNNIDFLIIKGGCMRHLRPEYPRVMGDIDILVDKKHWKKCGQIAEKLGYDVCWDIHSMDLHPKGSQAGIMDIHKYIILESDKEKSIVSDIFKRAVKQMVFGVETYVPCNEDLLFISLVNMIKNLRHKTSYAGILYNLFDCKFLIDSKPDFDWNIVVKNARKTKAEPHLYFAIRYINNIVPGLLPESFKMDNDYREKFRRYCILLIYQRFYLWNMKQKLHKMKIQDLFSSSEFFKQYLKFKPKYFVLKLSIIKNNPFIAHYILKRAYKNENN